jgi:hypothetical protein
MWSLVVFPTIRFTLPHGADLVGCTAADLIWNDAVAEERSSLAIVALRGVARSTSGKEGAVSRGPRHFCWHHPVSLTLALTSN